MKILIVYTQAGEGHRRAASALYNCLKENYKELQIQLIDTLEYSSFLFKHLYHRTYTILITRLPWLWALIYHISRIGILRRPIKYIRYFLNSLNTKRFTAFLREYKPDFVVVTHFMPAAVVSFLKEKRGINSKLITVITDYNVHPFWITDGANLYIVACDYAKNELLSNKISADKIEVLGIPVDSKFQKTIDKNEACRKLSIDSSKFTALVATSGFGIGPLEEIVDLLHNEVQLLVVCGRNENLYRRLAGKNYPLAKIFGFVNNIEELMAACDIYITKPGGMTISESLTMNLPMIFIADIAGQEVRNAKIMVDYGVAIAPNSVRQLKDTILRLKDNPALLNSMREKVGLIRKPYAAKEICACFLQK